MKLLELIRPRFGSISICSSFLGDSRNEIALDRYDKDGITRQDANYNLYATLNLEDEGFREGMVRLEYDEDNYVTKIHLEAYFKDAASLKKSHLWVLRDYLSQSDYFEDCSFEDNTWAFWNFINQIHCEESETAFFLEIYPIWAEGDVPSQDYAFHANRTVSSIIRHEQDDWMAFAEEAMAKKIKLCYSRESEDYPSLWLVIREEEFKQNPSLFTMHLTKDLLRRIMTQADWKYEAESWGDNSLERIIYDPVSGEPMVLIQMESSEMVKPMTFEQLDKAFDEIGYGDKERTS